MYRLGDKYQVPSLCDLATVKFTGSATKLWSLTNKQVYYGNSETFEAGDSIDKFTKAIRTAYSSTPDTNRGMRDVVIGATLDNYHHLMNLESLRVLIREELPAFGADLFLLLHERSWVARQSCQQCQLCKESKTMPYTFVVARACGKCRGKLQKS